MVVNATHLHLITYEPNNLQLVRVLIKKKKHIPSVARSKPAANTAHKRSKRTKCGNGNLTSVNFYCRFLS